MFYRLDVSDEAAWNALVAEIAAQWGTVDILINNAGTVHASSLLDLTKDEFERVLSINLIGAWLGIKAVAPAMIAKGKGAIVNICSASALCAMTGLTSYGAGTWALRGVSNTAQKDLENNGGIGSA